MRQLTIVEVSPHDGLQNEPVVLSTKAKVYMVERMGFRTGVDLHSLLPTAGFLTDQPGHQVPAMLPKAGPFP